MRASRCAASSLFDRFIVFRFAEMTVGAGPTLRLFKMGSAGFGDFGFLAIVAVAGPRQARAGLASYRWGPPSGSRSHGVRWERLRRWRALATSGLPGLRPLLARELLTRRTIVRCLPPGRGGRRKARAVRPVRLLLKRIGAGSEFVEDPSLRLGFFLQKCQPKK